VRVKTGLEGSNEGGHPSDLGRERACPLGTRTGKEMRLFQSLVGTVCPNKMHDGLKRRGETTGRRWYNTTKREEQKNPGGEYPLTEKEWVPPYLLKHYLMEKSTKVKVLKLKKPPIPAKKG